MYRYEMHLHTGESSKCGVTPGKDYIAAYQSRGYDGIFITDHFYHGNTRPERSLPWNEYVEAYCRGYEEAKAEGDKRHFKVFFGIEENFDGDEYLIYGVDKEWLLAHPEARGWTREEMYALVHAHGGCVIQAHPFRDRSYITQIHLGLDVCDGIEAVNTANRPSEDCLALAYAKKFGLLTIAGSDTHNESRISDACGAIAFDKPLASAGDFAARVLAHDQPRLLFPADRLENQTVKCMLPAEIFQNGRRAAEEDELLGWCREAGYAVEEKRVRHVVCFKLKDPSEVNCRMAADVLRSMKGKVEMLEDIQVGVDFLHADRSYDVILQVTVKNRAALEAYQNHPYHVEVVKKHMHAVRSASVAVDYDI